MKAREVLDDCRDALDELYEIGLQGSKWKRRWFAAITLLRAVGHVLNREVKSYSKDVVLKEKEAWEIYKKENAKIFNFIKSERDNVLKQYLFGAGQGIKIVFSAPLNAPDCKCESEWSYPVLAGDFSGKDQREIISEGIMFWEKYIQKVESLLEMENGTS